VNRQECQKLIDSYVDWLRQGLAVEEVGGACELTTPLLDRLATTSDQFARLDDSPRNQMVPCPSPQVRYNDREYAAVGFDHADLSQGGASVYIFLVLLVMLVLPALSVVNERYFLGSDAGFLLLMGKWFVFWGVGIRLVSAGARQVVNPCLLSNCGCPLTLGDGQHRY